MNESREERDPLNIISVFGNSTWLVGRMVGWVDSENFSLQDVPREWQF